MEHSIYYISISISSTSRKNGSISTTAQYVYTSINSTRYLVCNTGNRAGIRVAGRALLSNHPITRSENRSGMRFDIICRQQYVPRLEKTLARYVLPQKTTIKQRVYEYSWLLSFGLVLCLAAGVRTNTKRSRRSMYVPGIQQQWYQVSYLYVRVAVRAAE